MVLGEALHLDQLVACSFALDDLYRGLRDTEAAGEEGDQLAVGGALHRWRGQADLERVPVRASQLRSRRPRLYPHFEAYRRAGQRNRLYFTRRTFRRRKSIMMYWPRVTVVVK